MRPLVEAPKCNMCGESCMLEQDAYRNGTDNCSVGGLIDCEVNGGYDSTPGNGRGALDDGDTYTFSLCEFCTDWMFSRFRIPPTMGSYMFAYDEERVFKSADQRVLEDDWRTMKEEYFMEARRRDGLRVNYCGINSADSEALVGSTRLARALFVLTWFSLSFNISYIISFVSLRKIDNDIQKTFNNVARAPCYIKRTTKEYHNGRQ